MCAENHDQKEPMGFIIKTLKSVLKEVGLGLRVAGRQRGHQALWTP